MELITKTDTNFIVRISPHELSMIEHVVANANGDALLDYTPTELHQLAKTCVQMNVINNSINKQRNDAKTHENA